MRNPSALSSMYRSRPTAAVSNLSLVRAPSSRPVTMVSSRSTSRSTTTAYRPSLPPKCSYTTGWETSALAAISSIEVPSRPRSANSRRPMSSSCSRRSLPVILLRPDPEGGWLVTAPSCQPADKSANRAGHGPLGHGAELPRAAGLLPGKPGLVRPADVVDPAELLGYPDEPGGDVDLTLQHPVPRTGRVGVVQVVPGLAEGQDRQPVHVPRLVPDLELFLAERVADRVDRPGHVVQERDADQAGPEERDDCSLPGPRPQAADQGGGRQGRPTHPGEPPGVFDDVVVGEPVRAELLLRGAVGVEQPADVSEAQTLGQRLPVGAVPPGRVRVAFLVAVLVMPAVIGDPGEQRSIDGQGAGDRERDLEAAGGLERAVGEVAVEAHADAEPRDRVEHHGDHDFAPAEAPAPGQRDRGEQREHRHGDEDAGQDSLEGAVRFRVNLRQGGPARAGRRRRWRRGG